jgi:hypothetical protein
MVRIPKGEIATPALKAHPGGPARYGVRIAREGQILRTVLFRRHGAGAHTLWITTEAEGSNVEARPPRCLAASASACIRRIL